MQEKKYKRKIKTKTDIKKTKNKFKINKLFLYTIINLFHPF